MKLLELYEELFQYICRLNRASKTPAQPDYARVRFEIKELMEKIQQSASAEVGLMQQAKRMELPIVFFVDFIISNSRLKFAGEWAQNRLASERNELAGDERFFDFLEEDLRDTSEAAAERLAVFYTCLGLGFSGMLQGQPDQIKRYLDQIFPRIRQWIDSDPRTKISEEAYQFTDTRVLTEPPSNKIILVALVFVFLSLSVMTFYYALYGRAVQELNDSVQVIQVEGTKGEARGNR